MNHRGIASIVIFTAGAGKRAKFLLWPATLQPEGQRVEAASVTDDTPQILRAKSTVQLIF
jgi:hypothetical protein